MKVILSRKGMDTSNGNIPNLILPKSDGTCDLVMLPIPNPTHYCTIQKDKAKYKDLHFEKATNYPNFSTLLKNTFEKKKNVYWEQTCHADPNLIDFFDQANQTKFLGTVGQAGESQSHLQKINKGDIFIFFGSFCEAREAQKGETSYFKFKNSTTKHIMFGYLQVGEIIHINTLTPKERKKHKFLKLLEKHPHWNQSKYNSKLKCIECPRYKNCTEHPFLSQNWDNNTIYLASENLSIEGHKVDNIKGWGMFTFKEANSQNLILTKTGFPKSRWKLSQEQKQALENDFTITYHPDLQKNIIELNDKDYYFQSTSPGQEFIIESQPNNPKAEKKLKNWVFNLIKDNI